jgi:hypothetical protein
LSPVSPGFPVSCVPGFLSRFPLLANVARQGINK